MMKNNVSLRFYLNKSKVKGAKQPIYFRIILNRKKAEIATKYHIVPKDWNEDSQRTHKNKDVNQDLADTEAKVYDIIKTLEKSKRQVTPKIIKDHLTEKNKFDTGLIESFDRYITRLELAGEIGKETISHFNVTKNYLLNFLREKGTTEFPIESIDYNFIDGFDLFLLRQRVNHGTNTMQRNTANKHHSRLRTILLKAMREGYITKNAYVDFKLKKVASTRTFLTDDELRLINEHSLGGNESLLKVRDIFIFSVYTGLRFEDAQNLTINSISKEKGKQTIRIKQEKTDEPTAIPLLPQALEIIHKYEDSAERKVSNKVLPKITNQKMNTYLKVIADIVGIKKNLTHHVARHTLATTILLGNEVPIEAVSKWLGHTNIKTTQVYAKITNDYLQKIADKLVTT